MKEIMPFVRLPELTGVPAGNGGLLKHVAAPWTVGTKDLWLGVLTLPPGGSTSRHALPNHEGLHYTLSGRGKEVVGDREIETGAGTCVYISRGAPHQVFNTGDQPLVLISVTNPPLPEPAKR
jgi:mannose-6-phosphate isomerase-like protein (cupin superfamily)